MANSFIATKKSVVIGGAIVGALVLALGANFVILPAVNSIGEVNTAIEEAQFAKDDADTLLIKAQTDQKDYDAVKSLDQSLIGQFPDTGETQQLIETIQQGAIASGIDPTQLTSIGFTAVTLKTPTVAEAPAETPPAEEAPADPTATTEGDGAAPVSEELATEVSTPAADTQVSAGYGELELSVNITGSPTEIQDFLNFLNGLERAVIIQGVSLSPEGENGETVALSFSAKTYVYAQIPDPTEVVTTTEEVPEENAG